MGDHSSAGDRFPHLGMTSIFLFSLFLLAIGIINSSFHFFVFIPIGFYAFVALKEIPKVIRKQNKETLLTRSMEIYYALGVLCAIVMILKGVHIWSVGWESITLDPTKTEQIASKDSIGLTFVLALKYMPQVLVFGYSFLLWRSRDLIKKLPKMIGLKSVLIDNS